MRLQELLKDAEQRRTTLAECQAAEQAERKQRDDAALDARVAEFRAWLGDLAEDLVISDAHWVNGEIKLSVKPHDWRFWTIDVILDRNPGALFSMNSDRLYAATATNAHLGDLMAKFQRDYEDAVVRSIANWREQLVEARNPDSADAYDRMAKARHALIKLAPERTAEWDALYAQAVFKLDEVMARRKAEEAQRAAALDQFRAARLAWVAECAADDDHKKALRDTLVAQMGGVTLTVQEVEYGVAADVDGERYVETRNAWVKEIDIHTGQATVMENGRTRPWRFRSVIRVSEPITARPELPYPNTSLFLFNPRFAVAFTEFDEAIVLEAEALWQPWPAEPSWDVVSGGMKRTNEVYEVIEETSRAVGETAVA